MSTPRYQEAVRALIDEIAAAPKYVRCPVSDLAGPEHFYAPGTGVTVDWDVMGDDRSTVMVCPSCAEVID